MSLPDIDCDVPVKSRDQYIQYIRDKYGHDKVAQIATYGRMQGRAALCDDLRVNDRCSPFEIKEITKFIPDEAKIADDLQEMKEEEGESSIIQWALENNDKKMRQWCYLEDGQMRGPLAKDFAQAKRLEGTKRGMSKHAAGIVISTNTLAEVCPLVYDGKTKTQIAALEMKDLESLGLVKLDVLGVAVLDKIQDCVSIIRHGITS